MVSSNPTRNLPLMMLQEVKSRTCGYDIPYSPRHDAACTLYGSCKPDLPYDLDPTTPVNKECRSP